MTEFVTPTNQVSNHTFLTNVAGPISTASHLWYCGFSASPKSRGARWAGAAWKPGSPLSLHPGQNAYFSVAELQGGQRRKDNFVRLMALVVDDLDPTKMQGDPTWILETSPGNFQVGFSLVDTPETRDLHLCTKAHNLLAERGLIGQDRSGNNPVRYVRLPVGMNTKPRESGNFEVQLVHWQPDKKLTLDESLEAIGIDPSLLHERPTGPNTTKVRARDTLLMSIKQPPEETPREIARISTLLDHINADCSYDFYRDVVWAILSTRWNCAEDLARCWSLTAEHRWNEETFEALVASFDAYRIDSVTVGTLYFHATNAGWHA